MVNVDSRPAPDEGLVARYRRHLFFGMGVVFVGLGYIGAILPLMPSTVFFILALWSFKKSSPKMEEWLLANPVVGPTLRNWEEDRSIALPTKIVAIALLWVAIGTSSWYLILTHREWVAVFLGALALWVTWFIASRRTKVG